MREKHNILIKPTKPPFSIAYVILLSCLLIHYGAAQSSTSPDEQLNDDIQIIWTPTENSINFTVADPDNYEIQSVSCRSQKNLDGENEHICENLSPCLTYFATLYVKNLSDSSQPYIEKVVQAQTNYAEPIVVLEPVKTGTEELNLTWQVVHMTCVSNFQIDVKSVEKDYKWTVVVNDKTFLHVDELEPCEQYNIQLKTYDVNKILVSNQSSTSWTDYAEPGEVNVTLSPHGKDMKATWDLPSYKTCITSYTFKWSKLDCEAIDGGLSLKELENMFFDSLEGSGDSSVTEMPTTTVTTTDEHCEWSSTLNDENAKEFIIKNLEGCENYEFAIYINSNSTPKSEKEIFTSPQQVPGVVTFQLPVITSTNISIYWNPPTENLKCVQFYNISATGPLQRPEEDVRTYESVTTDTSMHFDNLDPCGHYNYSVTAIALDGTSGITANSSFDTLEEKPSAVRVNDFISAPYSLEISWQQPLFADLCLNGYRLSLWKLKSTLSEIDLVTNDTFVRFEKLNSCQAYTIQIIPTTKTMDGELTQIEAETSAIVAQSIVFEKLAVYPNGIELNARDQDTNNNCDNLFAHFRCDLADSTLVDVPYKTSEQYIEKVGGITFTAFLSPLSPNTKYKCNCKIFNVAGWSAVKDIVDTLGPYYPDTPLNVGLKTKTNSSIHFSWETPKFSNGNIKLYITHFQRVEAAYFVPSECSTILMESIKTETSSLELTFPNLTPYTRYSIQIAAQNEYGIGEYTRPFMGITEPWVSEKVQNLNMETEGPYASQEEYRANVLITWMLPCKSNGEISYFLVKFVGVRENYGTESFTRHIKPEYNRHGKMVHNETDLKPQYQYKVSVEVQTKDVDRLSDEEWGYFDAPAGIPKKLSSDEVSLTQVSAYEADNPTISAKVRFPKDILESESGSVLYVALLISEKSCNPEPQLVYAAMDSRNIWPNSLNWVEVYEESNACISQYQTTPLRWDPLDQKTNEFKSSISGSRELDDDDFITYTIGSDKCKGSMERYCNGPLRADTEYYLVIRLFTKSGYSDAVMLEFKTDSLIQLTIILSSVISCLLFAFIAGLIYLWVTKRIAWHRESCHGLEDLFGDIVTKNFAIYYRDVAKPEKLLREFKELTMVAMDLSYSASELGCNKNRYADIFPYDKNRVILDIDAEGSDYINASFIDGYRRKKEYIATQGPKLESTLDFWRMVLQHNVRVIVMVTQFREADVVKCHEYFPYKSKGINVSIKKKETFELYDRTEIYVSHYQYDLKQKVVHFYFKKWPDHGVPSDPNQLITFAKKVKSEKVPSYSPIVVHCSAGVGRTGTFIGLDIIMQRIKSESKINVYETVKKLRFQRMKMVQTQAQYNFLYICAYELVKHKAARHNLQYQNKVNGKKVSFEDDNIINERDKASNSQSNHDIGLVSEKLPTSSNRPMKSYNTETSTYNSPSLKLKNNGFQPNYQRYKEYDQDISSDILKENTSESVM
ncbi:phosphatidylinositol phosphatase PTPRQ [Teleopsis dalmanni]|uniref:phosphatidylinositol phosphatase PTPRQ n=1 Tax=Teleopsis dalmanni TaxID=139649 RepID=UPI0018CCD66B|nr:phosphatidylinositol phosphatase PTPRQ [Teleopsis dalmanni]XP_037949788.1 phosphatidylinositol phosphatase PTPRQ [Teleopsis dalmanni]XP_037949789.1 phosphatidylinositol phosphatase PTPRQ [Teleopsis dalmanni]XP_037949790.1 phosphatidylinositol phosphatase PTPRQ [Teleopsis dalmanni]